MTSLPVPWLSLLVLIPAAGAAAAAACRSARLAHAMGIAVTSAVLPLAAGAWLGGSGADPLFPWLAADDLNQPLFPCLALMVWAVAVTTPRARRTTAAVAGFLATEALLFLTFGSTDPWLLALLFSAGLVFPWMELRAGHRAAARIFALYMGAAAMLFAMGVALGPRGALLLLIAVFIRKGILPVHSWMPIFFHRARPAAAILFSVPQVGTYCAARLLLPGASEGMRTAVLVASLLTAVYGAALALVQRDARRMFGFFFMSQSALVLAGLACGNLPGVTGGLTLWVASVLALSGFGITLRALEARRGPLMLDGFHGGYERMPLLAISFLILGLSCVGIPGSLGFVGGELLLDGSVEMFPAFGMPVALAVVLNAVTVVKAYGSLFCGTRSAASWALRLRLREQAACLALVSALLAAGVVPGALLRKHGSAAARLLPSPHRETPLQPQRE